MPEELKSPAGNAAALASVPEAGLVLEEGLLASVAGVLPAAAPDVPIPAAAKTKVSHAVHLLLFVLECSGSAMTVIVSSKQGLSKRKAGGEARILDVREVIARRCEAPGAAAVLASEGPCVLVPAASG